VRINGFPFLTQALAGRYTAIDVRPAALSVDPLHDLSTWRRRCNDVDAPLSPGDLRQPPVGARATGGRARIRIKDSDHGGAIGIEDLRPPACPSDQEIKELLPAGTPTSTTAPSNRAPDPDGGDH